MSSCYNVAPAIHLHRGGSGSRVAVFGVSFSFQIGKKI